MAADPSLAKDVGEVSSDEIKIHFESYERIASSVVGGSWQVGSVRPEERAVHCVARNLPKRDATR